VSYGESETEEGCSGLLYKPKSDNIPVYDTPQTTGRVIYKLPLGEKVCVLGEKDDFLIIDWKVHPTCCTKLPKGQGLAYANRHYLWPPPGISASTRNDENSLARFWSWFRFGRMVDDPLLPIRELTRPPVEDEQEETPK